MAKAARVAVRTAKSIATVEERLACVEQQNERMLAILEAMLTKPQREKLNALLDGETEGDDGGSESS